MPSTTSNNSDSAVSQALTVSDADGHIVQGFYDRSDGEQLVYGRVTTTTTKKSHLPDIQQLFLHPFGPTNDTLPRISSEEESGFSTPTRAHQGKKLVYEVVV